MSKESEGGINILLIITVVIGTVLMTSLLVCYICVFRQLCCPSDSEMNRSSNASGSTRRRFNRNNSMGMGEVTNVSSLPTEVERV